MRFPGGASGKESTSKCRRHKFSPWMGKIPWRRKWKLTPVFLLGESHGQRNLVGGRGQQRMRWLDGITDSMDMGLGGLGSWWWTGRPGVLQFMGSQRVGHDWVTELNWTETIVLGNIFLLTENVKVSCRLLCDILRDRISFRREMFCLETKML